MGALVAVGKMQLTTKRTVLDSKPIVGRGWVVMYRLDLSPFPRKRSWEEIRKGAMVAPFPEEKGAISDEEGCQIRPKRVPNDAAHIRKIREVNRESEPPAPEAVPVDLISGFRELLPGITTAAIESIWKKCQHVVPDCVPSEVLWLAALKLNQKGIENPVAILFCLEHWFEPALVTQIRKDRECRAAQERERQQREAEQLEWFRREQAADEKAKQDLAEMEQNAPDQFAALQMEAEREMNKMQGNRLWPTPTQKNQILVLMRMRLRGDSWPSEQRKQPGRVAAAG